MAVAGHDADQVETMKPVPERIIKITFNADRHASMQWNFRPQQTEVFVSISSYLCSYSGYSSKQEFSCCCLLGRWFLERRHWHSTEQRTPQINPSPASPPTMWFPSKLDSTSTRSRWSGESSSCASGHRCLPWWLTVCSVSSVSALRSSDWIPTRKSICPSSSTLTQNLTKTPGWRGLTPSHFPTLSLRPRRVRSFLYQGTARLDQTGPSSGPHSNQKTRKGCDFSDVNATWVTLMTLSSMLSDWTSQEANFCRRDGREILLLCKMNSAR